MNNDIYCYKKRRMVSPKMCLECWHVHKNKLQYVSQLKCRAAQEMRSEDEKR